MPVRIWLHTQRVLSEHGPMENDFFNKLPVNGNSPTVSKKKAKGKGRREKKKSSKAIPSEVAEGPEEPEDLEATKSIETPEGSDNKESEIEPATVPNPEPSVLEGEVNPAPVNNQEHLPKKPPTLRIDTTTGNMRWKHKRAAGSDGVINPEHVHKLTHERGHSHPRLFTTDDPTSLLTQFAPVPGQESTKNASLSPIHSSPMPASSTSFKTARSQVTPHTSLSSSAPPKFLTPISAPLGKSKEDIEAQTGTPEPQPSGEQDPVTPNLCETEIQHPVLKVEEEPCVSGKFFCS